MLHKSILPSAQARHGTVGFMSMRLLRSASVSFNTFLVALLNPQFHYRDKSNRLLQSSTVAPQENVASQLFLLGLAARIGTESAKGTLLLHRHFIWNQHHREKLLHKTQDIHQRYLIISAQCIEFLGYLGFFRSAEVFGLWLEDVTLVPPSLGSHYDLPVGVGMVGFYLFSSTKSSQTAQVDLVLPWGTSGGFCIGLWFSRLLRILPKFSGVVVH